MTTLGHLSDLHATDPSHAPLSSLLNKRFLGWISWRLSRRRHYRPEVLDALIRDLHEHAPDHVVITGDLTNISLEKEFEVAARVLRNVGEPDHVLAIPGNHDAYVDLPFGSSWGLWGDYLASDPGVTPNPVKDWKQKETGSSNMFAYQSAGPSVRVRGDLALVGVSSAIPTPLFFATGEVGTPQLERLEQVLSELGERGLCRVVLVHHPVLPKDDSHRRGLRDAVRFRAVLARAGAELVLHGHDHRTTLGELPAKHAPIPVVGGRSSSYGGAMEAKNSHYHLYDVRRESTAPGAEKSTSYRITMRVRSWDRERGAFQDEGSPQLISPVMSRPS